MRNFFAILGGMGTLATESFTRTLDRATGAGRDQDFLNYLVFNDASVPDRTAYINDHNQPDPYPALAEDVRQASDMGASFIVIACNTAHYFHERLQAGTSVPIIHMPRTTIEWASEHYPAANHPRLGFMGTEGTRDSGLYRRLAKDAGYQLVEPGDGLQERVNALIYEDVKGGRLDRGHYEGVIHELLDGCGCDAVLLGCTELSALNEAFPLPELPIVDAQAVTVDLVVRRAKAEQGK
ncbi:aspartate racemase [Bifidobacterium actinocoloniiforme DSM 22766]|uniref:Aspartate racemase n=1 Tax=Bifidobacterium actinocoloniiforme DSM 22766 TaxID=1437605 RepID=A0A086Z0Z3_9BIFI|nr:amino acid racemase [Bifidobacterium actinocoloniiforme]AKV55375.1 aspartate racemase [Bifidobacterium actinocoloniiforme DSM 22766]KFI40193.1 aspartate racemase [Bifidobacterium actinocoloniiforme DSM 22766]